MPDSDSKVQFKFGSSSDYAHSSHDDNTLYFITDRGSIYKGSALYTPMVLNFQFAPQNSDLTDRPIGTLWYDSSTNKLYARGKDGWLQVANNIIYTHPTSGVTAGSKGDTVDQTPSFGGSFSVTSGTVDAQGHLTRFDCHSVKIPDTLATSSAKGLMSSTDKAKLDNITPEDLLTNSDIVVCTQSEYDAMQTKSGLLYFIKEASS